jgi:hypothetical protein
MANFGHWPHIQQMISFSMRKDCLPRAYKFLAHVDTGGSEACLEQVFHHIIPAFPVTRSLVIIRHDVLSRVVKNPCVGQEQVEAPAIKCETSRMF